GRRASGAPAGDGGDPQGVGPAPPGVPVALVLLFQAHARPPARRGLRLRCLPEGRRYPVYAVRRAADPGRIALGSVARRRAAVALPQGLRLHAPDRLPPPDT